MSRTIIVTLNYHSENDTEMCIKSIKKYNKNIPIVVVDNSTHKNNLKKNLLKFSGVKLIKSPDNIGFGRGNNLGIKWAISNMNCEFIFLLNNDTIINQDTIIKLENEMDLHRDTGCVSPRILTMKDPTKLWYGGGDINWKKGRGKTPGFMNFSNSKYALKNKQVTFASGCAMLIRKKVFDEIGGFDPQYFMYEEDLEFCLRMLKNKWKIRYVSNSKIYHKVHGSQENRSGNFISALHPDNPNADFHCYHITRNKLLNMYKYARGRNRILFGICFPIYFAKDALKYLLSGRISPITAMINGVLSFMQNRKNTFSNELIQTNNTIE